MPQIKTVLTPTLVTTLLSIIYVLLVLSNNQFDPLTFVVLGTKFSQGIPEGTQGYDGQFAYQIALNPFEAAPYLDVPAYRYQRIFYPILARLLAFAQPPFIPWTLILLNLVAIIVGTWATEQLFTNLKISRWYAFVYGLYGGQILALRTDMNEVLAQALVQLAILAWVKRDTPHHNLSKYFFEVITITAFALAALTKETTLIFWSAYFLHYGLQRDWRTSLKLLISIVPFIIYQLILWRWLGQLGVGSGGAGATPFSLIPLGGWLAVAPVNLMGFLLISLGILPMSILPALAGLWLSGHKWYNGPSHPYIISLFLHSLILLCLPASTMREPAAMARLTQGLVVAMLLYGGYTKSWRVLMYSTLWLFTVVLLINGVAA